MIGNKKNCHYEQQRFQTVLTIRLVNIKNARKCKATPKKFYEPPHQWLENDNCTFYYNQNSKTVF